MTALHDLTLERHGAQLFENAASAHMPALLLVLAELPGDQAGVRIGRMAGLRPFLAPTGVVGALASRFLGAEAKAVRAILFDKSEETNWSLGWHQDRTICVRKRVDVDDFGPWSTKSGLLHVAPPFGLLSRMVTLRVHLDDVPASNAPLLIAPGSHLRGRIAVEDVDSIVARCGTIACLASAGDIWAYSTPVLHASEAARPAARRRVLQVDFSADALPGGLEWLGV